MNPDALDYLRLPAAPRPRSRVGERLAITLLSVASAVAILVALFFGVAFLYYQSTAAAYPPLEEQLTLRGTGITTVYDRHGEPLGVLSNPDSAIAAPVELAEISPHLITATISTEDNSYWEHRGFDVKGLARAAWTSYVTRDSTTGGSTITQQLIKTAYFTTDCHEIDGITQCTAPRTVSRKLKEIVLAVEMEGRYPKEAILKWYLNSISYSGRYVGVEAASQGYFEKPARELTLAESALLAGIPAAPTQYNPRTNCLPADTGETCMVDERGWTALGGDAKARQEYVLDLMVRHGHISDAEAAAAKAERVMIAPGVAHHNAAAFIDNQVAPRLVRMCQAGLLPQLEGARDCVESVHTAGYRVTTTLDWQQNLAAAELLNRFVNEGLVAGCDCHNGAIVTIEPTSGQVVVYVPNRDPTWVSDTRVSGNIDQLAEINQPGSAFKPAVYLAWMDGLNKTPMSSLWDTNPLNLIDKPAKPEDQVTIINPGRDPKASQGLISARAALGGSQNVPAFRAAVEVGPENVIAMAKALGITTLDQSFDPTFRDHESVIYGPSIATGGANIRAIDLAYMNATIANMGVMVGVPTYASTLEPGDALSTAGAEGDALEKALNQRLAFLQGYTRLPGTRELDPVVVLKVETPDGETLYEHGFDLEHKQVVDGGSVWMLHTIMSDCTARFLIWGCGASNSDLALDAFLGEVPIPGGVKTGTQQTASSAKDTLATWMVGYSRYGATAVWIGNADKTPVRDGPEASYATGNTTVRLFKHWAEKYHSFLQAAGMFTVPAGFDELQPANVKLAPFQSAATERGRGGGCFTRVNGWQRTDIEYLGDCLQKACVPLPEFKKEAAITLARSRGIPACGVALPPTPTPTPDVQATPTPQAPETPAAEFPTPGQGQPDPAQPAPTPQGEPTRDPKDPKDPKDPPKPGDGGEERRDGDR